MSILFFLSVFWVIVFSKLSSKNKLIIAFILSVVFASFTFGVGSDYFSYEYIYNSKNLFSSQEFSRIDIFFKMLIFFSNKLSISYHVFAVLIKIIILALSFSWICYNSKKEEISVLLYLSMFFLVWTMSALRQGLALALVLYFIYNKKFNFSVITKVIIVFTIAGIHLSSIFSLIFIFTDKFKFNKRKHIKLLLFSILALMIYSLLPIDNLVEFISFIPGIASVSLYIDPSVSLLNFSTLTRILFFVIVLFSYDELAAEGFKNNSDIFLLGISFYFILKFSDITAARLTIYSYVQAVLIFPVLLFYFIKKAKLYLCMNTVIVLAVIFPTTYFLKDIYNYNIQIGFHESTCFFSVQTIFNPNYALYDNVHAFVALQSNESLNFYNKFKEQITEIGTATYNNNLDYLVVQDPITKLYGVISDRKEWLVEPLYFIEPILYDGYIQVTDMETLESKYIELETMSEIDFPVGNSINWGRNQNELIKEWKPLNRLEIKLNDWVTYPNSVQNIEYSLFSHFDFIYYVVKIRIYNNDYYLYFNGDGRAFNMNLVNQGFFFINNGFIKIEDKIMQQIYNKKGELIWVILK